MLAFPINVSATFPWAMVPTMNSLSAFLKLFSLKALSASVGLSFSPVGFYLCLSWIVAIVVTAVWCGYSFSQKHFRVLWPLKFLRFGAKITTTGLFIPMTSVLLSAFDCKRTCWCERAVLSCVAT
jgi:hypothetical protein